MICCSAEPGIIMDIVAWLRSLGLERYEAEFREDEINEKVLPSLTAEDLKEIGVGPVGHRRLILEAIAALRLGEGVSPSFAHAATTLSAPNAPPEDRAERRQVTVMFPYRHCKVFRHSFRKFVATKEQQYGEKR